MITHSAAGDGALIWKTNSRAHGWNAQRCKHEMEAFIVLSIMAVGDLALEMMGHWLQDCVTIIVAHRGVAT